MSSALFCRTGRWGGVRSGLVAIAISGLGLAACGGGGGTGSPTTSTTAKSAAGATTPTSTHTSVAAAPGASGTLAAISGSTLEVQNTTSGQVSVVITKSTAITQTVKESLSQVIVGSCVAAIGKPAKSGTTTGPVAATSVTISKATSSGCTRAGAFPGGAGGFAGFAGGAGGFGGFAGGAGGRTTGSTFHRPTASGSFPNGGGRADFSSAFGKVTSVSKTGFALDVTEGTTKGSRTVVVSSSTTYSETAPATSSDLKVGQCVVAFGSTNTMGTVTAKTLGVSSAGSSGCSSGFGAGGAGFPGAGSFSGVPGGGSSSSDSSTGAASA